MKDDAPRGLYAWRGYITAAILLAAMTWSAGGMLAENGEQREIVKAWPTTNADLTVEHSESQDAYFIAALRKAATP